jgi:hypothetical protein
VAVATKVPAALRDEFAALAKRRGVTPSALLRALVEHELAGAPDGDDAGEVERAVRAEIAERYGDVSEARAATAVNLARRMDRAPTSGAQNAAQLRVLLAELAPMVGADGFDPLKMIRLQARLRRNGFGVFARADVAEGAQEFRAADWRDEYEAV